MTDVPKIAAVVVAGGSGERFGRPGGKQLVEIAGLPVLSWTLQALDRVEQIDLIVVVCPPERTAEYWERAVTPARLRTLVAFAPSGETRQQSVAAGLAVLPEEIETVAVHDGARPLVPSELVSQLVDMIAGQDEHAGAVLGHPSFDTLKIVEDGQITETADRSRFWAVQTPQVFVRSVLETAHLRAEEDGFVGTDDSSLVERLGGRVLAVEGPRDNIKVTVAEDLAFMEAALLHRGEER
jgi:2-C-methyl-D-erythritol 4-phosphate cytidylyltransferase